LSRPLLLIEDYAGVTVVTITSTSILDTTVIDHIAKELYALPDRQYKQRLVLDFSNVQFLSSQALGILITLDKKMKAIRGSFVMCGMRKELMKVFSLTKLDKLFRFYRDDTSALASFNVILK